MRTLLARDALDAEGRLALAGALYRAYHAQCFWHCPSGLEITEDLIPLVIKGLRTHGGRAGFLDAARLRETHA